MNDRIIASFLLAAGIAMAGLMVGNSIIKFRMFDRQVVVKGLAEKEVISDFSTWTIIPIVTDDNLQNCYTSIEENKAKIIEFLNKAGFEKEEIDFGNYTVQDMLAQTYRQNTSKEFRYLISSPIILKTHKVKLVKLAAQSQSQLTQKGIVFQNEGPFYEFTKFNSIKTEMLAEGIKNARLAAEKFAADSNSKVGSIKKASQGTFLIGPVGSIESNSNYPDEELTKKSLYKKIRVVTTLEYFLKDN